MRGVPQNGNIMTDRVPGLLNKDLSELDHIRAVELLAEVHHVVGSVLLIARTSSNEESGECSNGEIAAFVCSSRGSILESVE